MHEVTLASEEMTRLSSEDVSAEALLPLCKSVHKRLTSFSRQFEPDGGEQVGPELLCWLKNKCSVYKVTQIKHALTAELLSDACWVFVRCVQRCSDGRGRSTAASN